MTTKINDISTTLMTNAINTVKESKTRKAEAAFQSFLNNAVAGNSSQDKIEGFQSLSADSDKAEYSKDESFIDTKEVTDVKTVKAERTEADNSVSQDEEVEMTDVDEAENVLDEICEEMGIGREELLQQFEEFIDSIAAILMEKFGVTEEELYRVLETLGLSLTDMFNQTDLMNVVVELTGVQDIAAVLTDENLYGQIQEVVGELAQLKETIFVDQPMDVEQLQILEKSIETVMNVEVTTADDSELVINKDTVQNTGLEEQIVTKQEPEPVLEVVTDKKNESSMNYQEQQMTGNEAFQQFTGRVAQYTEQVMAANGNEFAQQADMEAIIRQVTDYVKMQVNEQTTSLEMQLHPDSYGKLNLQVSVRDGVVTARLAVENEMVRQALETQIVQLREDMSEKGLKVDAVEVAIASHEFERNLEEGQENSEGSREDADTARRQINLREEGMSLEELTAMSEAEALTRKIMLENGNSIDFSA